MHATIAPLLAPKRKRRHCDETTITGCTGSYHFDNLQCGQRRKSKKSFCKLLVYDGPTGKLPIIMKSNGTYKSQRIIASTFQVFVVLIEDVHQQKTVMSYAPIYMNTAVYNLTMKDNVEINFDNRTYCHGYSSYASLCVFTFYTSGSKIRFSLKDISPVNTAVVILKLG